MLRVAFFYLLLATVVALTIWRGRRDEQMAAGICVVGTLLTVLAGDELPQRFAHFDFLAFAVDVGVLGGFLAIALRSDRFWPLWVAGLQLTATTVHGLMLLSPGLPDAIFGAALAFWSYPILALIAAGALRTHLVERWRQDGDIATKQVIS